MDWSCVDYSWIIVMFLSALRTEFAFTANDPLRRSSLGLFQWWNKLICILYGLWVSTFSPVFHFCVNHSLHYNYSYLNCILIVKVTLLAYSICYIAHARGTPQLKSQSSLFFFLNWKTCSCLIFRWSVALPFHKFQFQPLARFITHCKILINSF